MGVADVAWAPKYTFPMALMPRLPGNAVSGKDTSSHSTEVKTLTKQMKAVLRAQAASQLAAFSSSSSNFETSPTSMQLQPVGIRTAQVSTSSRRDNVWCDTQGRPHHKLAQIDEFRETRSPSGVTIRSRRQHTCKVCSALRGDRKRSFATSYYSIECTKQHNGGMVFLCDKVRPHDLEEYRNATCSQIWHLMWNNGEDIPQSGTSSIKMRKKQKASLGETIHSNVSGKPTCGVNFTVKR
ncbi:unnamed protein product [Phytophthora lilii]|uniref:Unnamed protein product n=1 Tax=Phytophthora lilii TaxID=2077276 RepID=A0A9W6X8K4_9STRA|nr:unnamed protein product [Phytophthora lilii]